MGINRNKASYIAKFDTYTITKNIEIKLKKEFGSAYSFCVCLIRSIAYTSGNIGTDFQIQFHSFKQCYTFIYESNNNETNLEIVEKAMEFFKEEFDKNG